jgi:DNA replication and repair protein RecF
VVGPNASGKTNLLESVLLICGSNSFRAQLGDVVKNNHDWFRIEANFGNITRSLGVDISGDALKKKYTINDTARQRLRFEDILPTVIFEPENMRMLTGSPELRREFLDEILSIIDPIFGQTKKQYIRVLAQRNKLLKMGQKQANTQMFVWNIRLSELAGYMVEARIKLIDELNSQLSQIYSEIAGHNTTASIKYQSNININNYETNLMHKLEQNLELDALRGFTGYGPHRDDFNISLKGAQAKTTASRGETRTLVLSLKLLQVQFVKQKRSTAPIILLDDVFSELDGFRRKALTSYLHDNQTIITTTDADIIAKDFAQHTNTIMLS